MVDEPFDCIVVLGGGVPLGPREQLPFVANRCDAAAEVFHAHKRRHGKGPAILCLSAGTAHAPQLMSATGLPICESTVSAAHLIDACSIPAECIVVEVRHKHHSTLHTYTDTHTRAMPRLGFSGLFGLFSSHSHSFSWSCLGALFGITWDAAAATTRHSSRRPAAMTRSATPISREHATPTWQVGEDFLSLLPTFTWTAHPPFLTGFSGWTLKRHRVKAPALTSLHTMRRPMLVWMPMVLALGPSGRHGPPGTCERSSPPRTQV